MPLITSSLFYCQSLKSQNLRSSSFRDNNFLKTTSLIQILKTPLFNMYTVGELVIHSSLPALDESSSPLFISTEEVSVVKSQGRCDSCPS